MPSLKGLRFLKRPVIRASAPSALNAFAAVPNSGFAFVDNSQGASAAVAELGKSLDVALDQLSLESQHYLPLVQKDGWAGVSLRTARLTQALLF